MDDTRSVAGEMLGAARSSVSEMSLPPLRARDPVRRPLDLLRRNRGVAVVTAACLAFYLLYSLTDYAQYLSGNDLGIFDQAVRAYAHFKAPTVPVKAPGFDILGDHFHPIIALLAPLYWLWDNPCVLLIAQAVLVSLSIPVVFRFTARRADHGVALTIAAVYGIGWPVQSMVDFDFHEIAFAVPMFALAIDALDRRARRPLIIWCALLLLVREDMGLFVAILGLTYWLRGRAPDRKRVRDVLRHPPATTVLFVIGGAIAFVIATMIIVPTMTPSGHYPYWQFGAIGSTPGAAAKTIFTAPWRVVQVFFTPGVKATTFTALVAPVLWYPLRSPYVVLCVPLFAERFLNERPQLWNMNYHYSVLPWLILVLAFVDVIGRRRGGTKPHPALVWFVAVASVLALVRAVAWPHSPVRRIASWDAPSVTARAGADRIIPTDVCVAASSWLIPHLTPRDYVTLPNVPLNGVDYIALDRSRPHIGGYATVTEVFTAAHSAGYSVVYHEGAITVLRSPTYSGPSGRCHPLGPGKG